MTTTIQAICDECRYEFADPSIREPCPRCGVTRRKVFVTLQGEITMRGGLTAKQLRPGWPGFLRKLIARRKLSREGKEVHEVQEYDRSDMQKTVKHHRVEELQDGEWKLVHEHEEEYRAKRRPQ